MVKLSFSSGEMMSSPTPTSLRPSWVVPVMMRVSAFTSRKTVVAGWWWKGESVMISTACLVCETWGVFPARSREVSPWSRPISTSPLSSVSIPGCGLSAEVDPETSALCVGGARVKSQWSRTIIIPPHSLMETVAILTGIIEQTNIPLKEVSGEVIGSAGAEDEGESHVAPVTGSSSVSR